MISTEPKGLGVKSELLVNSFLTLFPGCKYEWKNSQGIFNINEQCMAKRSLCFSSRPVSFANANLPPHLKDIVPRTPAVWGLCGVKSTRANKATDSCFVLCRKTGKHFIAYAMVSFLPVNETSFEISQIDTNPDMVQGFLDDMKREKEVYSEERLVKKLAKSRKRARQESADTGLPVRQRRAVERAPEPEHIPEPVRQEKEVVIVKEEEEENDDDDEGIFSPHSSADETFSVTSAKPEPTRPICYDLDVLATIPEPATVLCTPVSFGPDSLNSFSDSKNLFCQGVDQAFPYVPFNDDLSTSVNDSWDSSSDAWYFFDPHNFDFAMNENVH